MGLWFRVEGEKTVKNQMNDGAMYGLCYMQGAKEL